MAGAENTFDGGTGVNLDSVTTANSGGSGNTPFDNITGTAPKFTNTFAHSGSLCMVATASGAQCVRAAWVPVTDPDVVYQRAYVRREAHPTVASAYPMGIYLDNSTIPGEAQMAVRWNHTTGIMHLMDNLGYTTWNSVVGMPLSQWIRVETWFDKVNAQAQIKVWTTDPDAESSPDYDSGVITGMNFNGSPIWRIGYGNAQTSSSGATYVDDVAYSTTGWIGPHGIEQAGVSTDVTVVMASP